MDSGPLHAWVDDVRPLFRPALTVLLWVTCGVALWLLTSGLIAGYLTEATVSGLAEDTVRSVVIAASTATVWWFGDRTLQPPGVKHR